MEMEMGVEGAICCSEWGELATFEGKGWG